MRKVFLIFLFLSAGIVCNGQGFFRRQLAFGDVYFEKKEFAFAIPYYKKAIKANKESLYAVKRLGECYFHLKRWKEAQRVFTYLDQKKPMNDTTVKALALITLRLGDVKQAKARYASVKDSIGKKSCDSVLYWQAHPQRYKVVAKKHVNTPYSEMSPMKFKSGIVFSSNKEGTVIRKKSGNTGQPSYNLYFLDSTGKRPVPFSTLLNSFSDEGSATFNGDYKKAYFSRARVDNDNVTRLKLYSAERKKLGWTFTQDFVFNDSLCSFGHPNVDAEDKLFFFVSDMRGGYGGTDIYVCVKIDSLWSNPINLGPMINTPGNESYPFYSSDEKLYFSSNGRIGMGGYDIYMAEHQEGEWKRVTNMKYPINSIADDYSFFIGKDGTSGFLSSDRDGGKGLEDIYEFHKY